MKKSVRILLLVMFFSTSTFSVSAQIYVNVRPVAPTVVVTPRPSPAHVWVAEDWEPYNNSYRYRGGYWVSPPHAHARWREGHWRHSRRGHVWVEGRWR